MTAGTSARARLFRKVAGGSAITYPRPARVGQPPRDEFEPFDPDRYRPLSDFVTGEGPITYIAQNGIQTSFGATALVRGNTVSGNWYTPAGTIACGLLIFQATGVKQQMNNLFDNEVNFCNFGRGGGKTKR